MTTKNETTKGKQAPAFYIFDTIEVDGKKEYKRVGAPSNTARATATMS